MQIDLDKYCLHCMSEIDPETGKCKSCGKENAGHENKENQLKAGEILHGRYYLGACLGEGGFGITYVARDLATDTRVAIKELYVQGLMHRDEKKTIMIERDQNSLEFYKVCKQKFKEEAFGLYKLKGKEGIVQYVDYFEENYTAYIVMEYLEGDDLSKYLEKRGGKIPFEEAFRMLKPIMKSLILLHEEGIFHRDIAPDNIRYLTNFHMKLMDLGGAKFSFHDQKQAPGMVMLKAGYAPPEQYQLNYKIGPWMDVYSMSATLYKCLTGEKPVPADLRVKPNTPEINSPLELGAAIGPAADSVIMKGLAIDIDNRYMDMKAFYFDLKKAYQDENCIEVGESTDGQTIHGGMKITENGTHSIQIEDSSDNVSGEISGGGQKSKVYLFVALYCIAFAIVLVILASMFLK